MVYCPMMHCFVMYRPMVYRFVDYGGTTLLRMRWQDPTQPGSTPSLNLTTQTTDHYDHEPSMTHHPPHALNPAEPCSPCTLGK